MDADDSNFSPEREEGKETSKSGKRLKFSNERTDLDQLNTSSTGNDDLGVFPLDDEGQGFEDDSEVILNKNQSNSKKAVRNKRKKTDPVAASSSDDEEERQRGSKRAKTGYIMPSETSSSSADDQNKKFESFMVWMDKFKQFEEWEKHQQEKGKGENNSLVARPWQNDKAVQSPSDSTIYSRMCESLQLDVMIEANDEEKVRSGVSTQVNRRQRCSSTATTVDEFEGVNESDIDSLIVEARKAAEEDKKQRTLGVSDVTDEFNSVILEA